MSYWEHGIDINPSCVWKHLYGSQHKKHLTEIISKKIRNNTQIQMANILWDTKTLPRGIQNKTKRIICSRQI